MKHYQVQIMAPTLFTVRALDAVQAEAAARGFIQEKTKGGASPPFLLSIMELKDTEIDNVNRETPDPPAVA